LEVKKLQETFNKEIEELKKKAEMKNILIKIKNSIERNQ